jgi:DNA-binding SARP family transcriptional activator
MARLSLSLLRPFQATLDGEPVTDFESNKVRALLAYLATEADRPHRRERLAGLLWPEWPDRAARNNLRYALSNLRQAIGDRQAKPPFLHTSRETIQFNSASDVWVDVTAFTRLLEGETQTVPELEEAVALYGGEFLEGFSLGDSAAFEEWTLFKREQIGRRVLSALRRLAATYEEQGEYERALPYAWRQVELEPWREEAHRQLMRLLAFNGQRGAALAQYEACRRALAKELEVEPATETTRLYEQIRDGDIVPPPPRPELASPPVVPRAPASPAPAGRHPSSWRTVGGRLTLIGGSLLFLIIVGAMLLFATRDRSAEVFTPSPTPVTVQPGEGKIVEACEGVTYPQICVGDVRSGRFIQLTDNLEFEAIGGMVWSPDGRQIVFNAGPDPNRSGRHDHKLYVINADGLGLRQITSGGTNDVMPAWSPDGEWIAFHRNGELWIVRPDGSAARMLLGDTDLFIVGAMAWSPDSEQIAFWKTTDKGAFLLDEVWIINRDGTAPRAVYPLEESRGGAGALAWSPDGRQIVCHYIEFDEEKVLLINADGSGEAQVKNEMPWPWFANFWPQWGRGE